MDKLLFRKIYFGLLGLCYPITYPLIYYKDRLDNNYHLRGEHLLLSFDVDYTKDIEAIPELLMILKNLSVKASFAIVGKHVETKPKIYEEIIKNGHELINHTYTHPDNKELSPDVSFTDLSIIEKKDEIEKCQTIVRKYLGYEMMGFRLPHFGNIQTIDFEWLFGVLQEFNFEFDTSVLFPNFKKRFKGFFENSPIIEIPVTTCPHHPYTALDSYHIYRSRRLIYRTLHHNEKWLPILLKAKTMSDEINIPVNVYLDPQDIIRKKNIFFNTISHFNTIGVTMCTYSDYINNLRKKQE